MAGKRFPLASLLGKLRFQDLELMTTLWEQSSVPGECEVDSYAARLTCTKRVCFAPKAYALWLATAVVGGGRGWLTEDPLQFCCIPGVTSLQG